jgi:UDP-2,3-diacylglucosamine pyrophosphatase LpxH
MKYIEASHNQELTEVVLFPIGDLHIGSPHFDKKELIDNLKIVDSHGNKARIIIMGDLAETALKDSVGAGVYEQQESAQHQMMTAKNLLFPYKDIIDGIVTGNHEERVYKNSGFDLMLYFAQIMGLEDKYLRYQGIINYTINQRNFNVSVWHGSGGGGTPGGAMNRLQKQAETVLADLYLMGHVHRRQAHTKTLYIPDNRNGKIDLMKQVFVVTGSALTHEGSYAEMAGFAPTEKGFPKITLSVERKTLDDIKFRKKIIKVEI